MVSKLSVRKLLLGFLAGLFSCPAGILIVYFIGIAVTAFKTRELLATLLVAGSFLPLMLIFVLLLPTLVIAILSGLSIAIISNLTHRISFAGLVAGFLLAEITLSVVVPLLVVPNPGDFSSIVSNPYLSGVYGLLVGAITVGFFKMVNRPGLNDGPVQ